MLQEALLPVCLASLDSNILEEPGLERCGLGHVGDSHTMLGCTEHTDLGLSDTQPAEFINTSPSLSPGFLS